MEFKLHFDIAPFEKQIQPDSKLFFAGSCFSEHIAALFAAHKFHTVSNTHGILYNPVSIASSVGDCLEQKLYTQNDLFPANGCWNSFQHHSRFSSPNAEQCLADINEGIKKGHTALKESNFIFITFGSAFVYKHLASDAFVSNCHKIPSSAFQKILLSKKIIIETYRSLLQKIRTVNPGAVVIFTVSPVRYIRDGVVENNRSKAILLQAVHELVETGTDCIYFPAYEIVNDELRDYRFFEEDLVHPNQTAIRYVWERLSEVSFSAETKVYTLLLDKVLKAIEHKPFHPNSESHKQFKAYSLRLCEDFERQFPFADLSEEKKRFV